MIKTFTDDTVKELHKRNMDALRHKLAQFDPSVVKQNCGFKRERYKSFMAGKLDNSLLGWQIEKIKTFIRFNSNLMGRVKSGQTFRLIGDPKKEPLPINQQST